MAADNMALGEFDLVGITPQVRGEAKVEVVFDIDANGIIHVSATDLQTDTSKRIRVEATVRPSEEAVGRLLGESRKRMESDRRKREEIEAAIRAENLIRAAEQLIDEASQIAPAQAAAEQLLQEAAETAVSAVRDALATGQADQIITSGKALESSLKKLSAAMKAATVCDGAQDQAA